MSYIVEFFKFLWKAQVSAVRFIVGLPGLIASAVAGCVAAVGSMFSHFTWFDRLSSLVQDLTVATQSVVSSVDGGENLTFIILGWFSFGRLVQVVGVVIALTVGVTVAAFVTMLVSTLAVISTAYCVRGVQKAVQICTGGLVDT